MPVVELRPAFEAALTARIEWLGEHAPEEWLDNFLAALATLRSELEQFPEAAAIIKQDARVVVRRRTFPMGLPYVVYYAHLRAERVAIVYLTHLFHERQRRPEIDTRAWPW